ADAFVPMSVERITFEHPLADRLFSHVRLRREGGAADSVFADVRVVDAQGRCVVEVSGLALRRLAPAMETPVKHDEPFYEIAWRSVPRSARSAAAEPGRWLIL